MALPVAPPANPFGNAQVQKYREDLKKLIDNTASPLPLIYNSAAEAVRAFDALVTEIELLSYDAGGDFSTRHTADGRPRLSPAAKLKYRVLNRPLWADGPTILQYAVASAFRADNNFQNTGALEIINRLLDSRFVDAEKLSPEDMVGQVQVMPSGQDQVVAFIRSQQFMAGVALVLRPRWRALASKIEAKLSNDGRESPTIV